MDHSHHPKSVHQDAVSAALEKNLFHDNYKYYGKNEKWRRPAGLAVRL